MASYLYRTTIWKNTNNVEGINVSQNNTDKTDFETNFKASAIKVTDVEIYENTFVTDESYATFKARVVSPVTWADVKYTENGRYDLCLLL